MKYQKAQDVLPHDLVMQLQEFIDGGYLYIPKKQKTKRSWGENTTTKKDLLQRNQLIYEDFNHGLTIQELAHKYYLVEQSIRRILRNYNPI